QVFPVGHFGDRAGALVADGGGRLREVGPLLGVGQRLLRRLGERRHAEESRMAHLVAASISARCRIRIGLPCRDIRPPMCIRQEVSAEASTSAPVPRMSATLSMPIAVEVSGFFTL